MGNLEDDAMLALETVENEAGAPYKALEGYLAWFRHRLDAIVSRTDRNAPIQVSCHAGVEGKMDPCRERNLSFA